MTPLEQRLRHNREQKQRNLTVFLNAGDPGLDTTIALLKTCGESGVDVVELGVPFANSFTDGATLIRSHERAIANDVDFETVIDMLKKHRHECKSAIVLLVDFSYTVKSRGVAFIVEQAALAGADGILMHGLPPLYVDDYIKQTQAHNIAPIFSLYPQTNSERMKQTLAQAQGFVYLVSMYGRTGSAIDFHDLKIRQFYHKVRQATSVPLMAGFGVKNVEDISKIFTNSELDGVIMGSQIANIIEENLDNTSNISDAVQSYVNALAQTKSIQTDPSKMEELAHVDPA
ncbi:tryptophan synthase subunit alpha [Alteromonas sp. a30]|uniref:tryptophan synthase subunit alpha n=1 Tax=Alteromonas sp. a30 TaxID=2730917 RepID=UPI00228314EE|nr:tryptophan synthase subunit alpha [Alteromonas sp. a30]MCY7296466.1 tryptophan synthase subunit alpha [Alteromonas sp. a30]